MSNLTLGVNKLNEPTETSLHTLSNHVAQFGMSGSGKTGMLLSLVEQVLEHKVPCLLVDIKGDLVNIIKQDGRLENKLNIRLLTPGATHGDTVNLFEKLSQGDNSRSISALLELLGLEPDPFKSPHHAYLTALLGYYFVGRAFSMEYLLPLVQTPGITMVGSLPLDEAITKRERKELAARLNGLVLSESFKHWRTGISLDFSLLFQPTYDHRVPVVIYSVAHIVSEKERIMALAFLLDEYQSWVVQQPGTNELKSLLVIDECHGLLPPYPRNPATKQGIMSLLKQARAFGCGVFLSTQNPKDIDYKALSNCTTWIVGKLQTKNDRDRVLEGLASCTSVPKEVLNQQISSLSSREFVVMQGNTIHRVKSLDTATKLVGPMTPLQLRSLLKEGYYGITSPLVNAVGHAKVLAELYRETNNDIFVQMYKKLKE